MHDDDPVDHDRHQASGDGTAPPPTPQRRAPFSTKRDWKLLGASFAVGISWWGLTEVLAWPWWAWLAGLLVLAFGMPFVVELWRLRTVEVPASVKAQTRGQLRELMDTHGAREGQAGVTARAFSGIGYVWYAVYLLPTGDMLEQSGWALTCRRAQRATQRAVQPTRRGA